jgi:hypothetical protein
LEKDEVSVLTLIRDVRFRATSSILAFASPVSASTLTFDFRFRAVSSSLPLASSVSASALTSTVWSRICERSFSDHPRASGVTVDADRTDGTRHASHLR